MKKMKHLLFLFASVLLVGVPASATTTSTTMSTDAHNRTFVKGYGNSFIFVEQGVEFAVFPDGQFDFNIMNYGPNFSAHADFGEVSISFNTGHGYDAYVQYDDFGAIVQIENIPIYYDYYGRITRAGTVRIRYNDYGYVTRVGSLFVHYNAYNRFSHCTGYINVYNRHYVYRPWHNYYVIPRVDLCIVYRKPYRRYYTPVRHHYYRPYTNNYRPRVSYSNSRRGTIAQRSNRQSDRYVQGRTGRRSTATTRSRSSENISRSRGTTRSRSVTTAPRRNTERQINRSRTTTRSNERTVTPRRSTRSSESVKRSSSRQRVQSTTRNSTPRVTQRSNRTRPEARSNRSSQRIKQQSSRASNNRKSSSRSSRRRQ